jgi:thioredoxin reductase (NADPH)
MPNPIILAVDDDRSVLSDIQLELQKRYASDYEIFVSEAQDPSLSLLSEFKSQGKEVAIILASKDLPETGGIEFLRKAAKLFPEARRGLLFSWGIVPPNDPILTAVPLNKIDAIVPKPDPPYFEHFHKPISDFLFEWSSAYQPVYDIVKIIDNPWSPRASELRDLLDRNNVPYSFFENSSEDGIALLQHANLLQGPFPILILHNGKVLSAPSNVELASALEVNPRPDDRPYDLVIIGAGPAGLSSAVYGASEGLDTLVIEREAFGGQAGTSSMIRNYLGFNRGISGKVLSSQAYEQAMAFGARFFHVHQATGLTPEKNFRVVDLHDGTRIRGRCVVLSMGVTYRRLGIKSLEELIGAGVYYGAARSEAQACKNQSVFVAGGGNSAGQAALHLAKFASRVTILVRSGGLETSMSEYLINEIRSNEKIVIRLNTQIIDGKGDFRLESLALENTFTGEREEVPAFALFILIGMKPHTDWLPSTIARDQRGFIITGHDLLSEGKPPESWRLLRPPMMLETSMDGVFAAGDVRAHSIKRVASAVGEGSIAIHHVHEYLAELGESPAY